eukprot:UN06561
MKIVEEQNALLEQEKCDLKDRLTKAESEASSKIAHAMQNNFSGMCDKMERIQNQSLNLKETIHQLEIQNTGLESQNKSEKIRFSKLEKILTEKTQILNELKQNLTLMSDESQTKKSIISDLESRIDSLQSESKVSIGVHKLETLLIELKNTKIDIGNIRQKIVQSLNFDWVSNAIFELHNHYTRNINELNKQMMILKKQIDDKDFKIRSMKTDKESLEASERTTRETIDQMKTERLNSLNRIENISNQLEEARNEIVKKTKECLSLQSQYKDITKSNECHISQLQQQQNQETNDLRISLENEVDNWKKQFLQSQTEKSTLQSENDTMKESIDILKTENCKDLDAKKNFDSLIKKVKRLSWI